MTLDKATKDYIKSLSRLPSAAEYKALSTKLTNAYRTSGENKKIDKITIKRYRNIDDRGKRYSHGKYLVEIKLDNLDRNHAIDYINVTNRFKARELFTNPNEIVFYMSPECFKDGVAEKVIEHFITEWENIFKHIDSAMKSKLAALRHVDVEIIEGTKLYQLIILALQSMCIFDSDTGTFDSTPEIMQKESDAYFKLLRNLFNKSSITERDIATIKELVDIIHKFHNGEQVVYAGMITDAKSLSYGKMNATIKEAVQSLIAEWCEPKVYKLTEAKFYKKLKKIPSDLVAYITIEGEAIKDANDKAMIISYTYSYVDRIDWYIELIDSGDTRYIVPHSKQYLVSMKTQLLKAINDIMQIKLRDRPLIDIRYPDKYQY